MNLKKIKLAGFKSFVDPATIEIPSDMTGIVGPNGCGKSNVVDALRWVMGQTARSIRASSLEDVIFNGTGTRKPIGQASVELIFDNADGSFGGQYASWSEVSVKRVIERARESKYLVNNVRCRRRDVADLFFGTGLGGNSYAMIEQGMISRIIEAKPEEMRLYVEEAAGISKYRERRRDTEIRMRHTRENLDRVLDIREEVDKQLGKLRRQARNAGKFKELRHLRDKLEEQVVMLEFRGHDSERETHERRASDLRIALEKNQAELRGIESELEQQRALYDERNRELNQTREHFYKLNADISGLEQDLANSKKSVVQMREEEAATGRAIDKCRDRIGGQETKKIETEARLAEVHLSSDEIQGEVARLENELHLKEEELAAINLEWDRHHSDSRELLSAVEVARLKLEYCNKELEQIARNEREITERRAGIDLEALEKQLADFSRQRGQNREVVETGGEMCGKLSVEISGLRRQRDQSSERLHASQTVAHDMRGRLASLQTLRDAGFGRDQQKFTDWLQLKKLQDAGRVATEVRAAPGWESAVEIVLGAFLEGIVVESLEQHAAAAEDFDGGTLVMFERTPGGNGAAATGRASLADKVEADETLKPLLQHVYPVDNLEQVLAGRAELAAHESLVTPGGVWMGRNWIRLRSTSGGEDGVLLRQKQVEQAQSRVDAANQTVAEKQSELDSVNEQLRECEAQFEAAQRERNEALECVAECEAGLHRCETSLHHGRELYTELDRRSQQLTQRRQVIEHQREELLHEHKNALASASGCDSSRDDLQERRVRCTAEVATVRDELRGVQKQQHEFEVEKKSLTVGLEGVVENVAQLQQQVAELEQRRLSLQRAAEDSQSPIGEREKELKQQLEKRADCEQAARERTAKLDAVQVRIHEIEERHKQLQEEREALQERHEKIKLEWQASRVRCDDLLGRIDGFNRTREEVERDLDEATDLASCRGELEAVEKRITRLGAINLIAAEEFSELSERKQYLDSQYEDLNSALQTLDSAIARIDRESREKFKDTFGSINEQMGKVFQRLFGGGHAYLELLDKDWLKGGVSVMVRPPGKRLSSIQLLSGGEKALAAMTVVFSIFELNPAPFCVLDEVDAPLDENNILRFCELLREMSDRVQFIVITHNRLTMEYMGCLIGITMGEPGVSRLVSVNVEEAARMVSGGA